MEQTRTTPTRSVRVRYESGEYGVALSIYDVLDTESDTASETASCDAVPATDESNGLLTVVETGVTTLELQRNEGGSTMLIWDDSEVEWASLKAS